MREASSSFTPCSIAVSIGVRFDIAVRMLRWRAADELMVSILPDQHPPVLNAANLGQVGAAIGSTPQLMHRSWCGCSTEGVRPTWARGSEAWA